LVDLSPVIALDLAAYWLMSRLARFVDLGMYWKNITVKRTVLQNLLLSVLALDVY
jgi:hypothetical protein